MHLGKETTELTGRK